MKVLLLNPPTEYAVPEYADRENRAQSGALGTEDFGLFPPLGLLYVLASLKQRVPEHEALFLDCLAEGFGHRELVARIAEIRPDVVGITSFTMTLYDVCLAARNIREHCPNVHLCLGGHHPIAFPFEAAQLPEFDSVIIGEGEEAFPSLVKSLAAGEDFTRIPGIYTRESIFDGGRPQTDRRFLANRMPQPAYVADLDLLPPRTALLFATLTIGALSARLRISPR